MHEKREGNLPQAWSKINEIFAPGAEKHSVKLVMKRLQACPRTYVVGLIRIHQQPKSLPKSFGLVTPTVSTCGQ